MKRTFENHSDMFDPQKGYLGFLLRQASHAYHLKMEKCLLEFGLTPAQFTVLKIISVYQGYSNADIARFAALTPQTVNLIVSKLVLMQLILKKDHPENKKVQCIYLHDTAQILLEQATDKINQIEQGLEESFTTTEIKNVRGWLSKILIDE